MRTCDPPNEELDLHIIKHARGARIVDGDDVISEIRSRPGPTHTLFDVLAAGIAALSPGPRVAVLGFAGGGLVAPLRGMQCTLPLRCVDLSLRGEAVFRKLSRDWAGEVRVDQDDALRWLRRQRRPWDCILEDLSLPATATQEGSKPDITFDALPELMAQRLSPPGVALINMLPMAGRTWSELEAPYRPVFRHLQAVHFEGYENRVFIGGRRLPSARRVSADLRRALHRIESSMAYEISVRTLAPAAGAR